MNETPETPDAWIERNTYDPQHGRDYEAPEPEGEDFMPTKTPPPNASLRQKQAQSAKVEIAIDIPHWEPASDDPLRRRYATVVIAGCPHHLEAIPVEQSDNGNQVGLTPLADDYLGDLFQGFGADSAFRTVTIDGQDYAVFMSPYCT